MRYFCFLLFIVLFSNSAFAEIKTERKTELLYMLEQDCGSCHGLTRKGGLGSSLLPESLKGKSDEVILDIIMNGIDGTPMPPWSELITEEEAEFLIQDMRNYNEKTK